LPSAKVNFFDSDQLSLKELFDPFTGEPVKASKKKINPFGGVACKRNAGMCKPPVLRLVLTI
jgi:hypothetical protein